jgi:hypothetical protein
VFSAAKARQSLLDSLTNRPDELVIAVLQALAEIPDAEVTKAMVAIGTDPNRPKEVRVAALKALARASRTIGDKLDEAQVASLQALAGTTDDEIRDAAGEALGGLDLDASEGAKLILKYGDMETPKPVAPPPPPQPTEVAAPAPPPPVLLPSAPAAPKTPAGPKTPRPPKVAAPTPAAPTPPPVPAKKGKRGAAAAAGQ